MHNSAFTIVIKKKYNCLCVITQGCLIFKHIIYNCLILLY